MQRYELQRAHRFWSNYRAAGRTDPPLPQTEGPEMSTAPAVNRAIEASPPIQGRSFPLGATVYPEGVNFSVYSKGSEAVELLLFDAVDDAMPSRVIEPDRHTNRTYRYWHFFVPGIAAGQIRFWIRLTTFVTGPTPR